MARRPVWNEDRLNRLKQLLLEGQTANNIAANFTAELGKPVTYDAVRNAIRAHLPEVNRGAAQEAREAKPRRIEIDNESIFLTGNRINWNYTPLRERLRELVSQGTIKRVIAETISKEFDIVVTYGMIKNVIQGMDDVEVEYKGKTREERKDKPDPYERIVQTITDYTAKLSPTPAPLKPEKHSKKFQQAETVVFVLSDCHVGEKWTLADTAGLGEWNLELAAQRFDLYTKKALHLCDVESGHRTIRRAVLILAGDLVSGQDIWLGQIAESDVWEQLLFILERLARFVNTLAEEFSEVFVAGLMGNHGRFGKRGQYPNRANLDSLANVFLKARFQDHPRVTVVASDSSLMAFTILPELSRWLVAVLHGQEFRSYTGSIPWYSLIAGASKLGGLVNRPINVLVTGHHHKLAVLPMWFGRIICNGAFCGVSPYAISAGSFMADTARQVMFMMHQDEPVTALLDIRLEEPKQLQPDALGFLTPHDSLDLSKLGQALK